MSSIVEDFIYTRPRPCSHDVFLEYVWKNKCNVRFALSENLYWFFLNFIQVAPVRITKLFFNGVLKAEAYSKPSKYLGWCFFLGIVNNEKPLTIFGKKPHRRCSTSNIETIPLNCYANSLFIM